MTNMKVKVCSECGNVKKKKKKLILQVEVGKDSDCHKIL